LVLGDVSSRFGRAVAALAATPRLPASVGSRTLYRQDGDLVLTPAQAAADADAYLASIGADGTATATANLVIITVTIVQPMQILSAAGLRAVTVHATASAVPVRGIDGNYGGFANSEGPTAGNSRVVGAW